MLEGDIPFGLARALYLYLKVEEEGFGLHGGGYMSNVHGKNSSINLKVYSIGNPLDAKASDAQKQEIPVEGGPAKALSL